MSAAEFRAALLAEGVRIQEWPDWQNHNRNHKGAWGPLNGVMNHHTAGVGSGMASYCYNGSADLPGPLCHCFIAKDGTVHLIGWGRANHAGGGDPRTLDHAISETYPIPAPRYHEGSAGAVDGNAHFVGFECENEGDGEDPWPDVQVDAMVRANAAVLRHYGWTVGSMIRHKDWSSWKNDPAGLDWDAFRAAVAARLGQDAGSGGTNTDPGGTDTSQPSNPEGYPGLSSFGPGQSGPHITALGNALVERGGGRFYSEGPGPSWGDADRQATAAFQRAQGWSGGDADGIPGPTTWHLLYTGTGNDIPAALPVVSVWAVAEAARRDPFARQGGTTHPDHVRPVERALAQLGYLDSSYAGDGSFGSLTVRAYATWQRSLGYRGASADGIPGKSSLSALAARTGLFTVTN